MEISSNYDLTGLNTFGVKAHAKLFVEVKSEEDLKELLRSTEFKENQRFFLGGGSNILFIKDFDGIVILNKLKGMEILEDGLDFAQLKSMSGENWHDLVLFAGEHGLWGIENLALIPGTVGASPIQNIGAYGVELKDTLESVEAFDIETGEKKIFSKEECELGYRESVFKNKLKGKYFISSITLRLSKIAKPNISYKILTNYLKENNIEIKTSKDVSDAVSAIRRNKLPDPKILGSAGSFFKNVVLSKEEGKIFLEKYKDVPAFEEEDGIKIPAGWLIEQCGPASDKDGASWKGYRIGNVGVHEKQALVLVNYGGAKGEEVKDLADQIIESVFKKFGLKLTPEVNLI